MDTCNIESAETVLAPHPTAGCGCGGGCACGGHSHAPGKKGKGLSKKFRKIHGSAGVIFGLFLIGHFAIGSTAHWPATFDRIAAGLHANGAVSKPLEILLAMLPLLILLPSGVYLLQQSGLRYNIQKCHRGNKVQFFLQRWTAVALVLFLAFHLVRFGLIAVVSTFDPNNGFASVGDGVRHSFGNTPAPALLNHSMYAFYLVGIVAVAFHLSNGLWTAAVARGFVDAPKASRTWGGVCCAFGIVIACLGSFVWLAFM